MYIPMPALIALAAAFLVLLIMLGRGLRKSGHDPLMDLSAELRARCDTGPTILPAEIEAQVRARLARRDKIGAIKLVRQATGMGLKDAKDHVERF